MSFSTQQRPTEMDERVWERMPEDCMNKILVRLPLPNAFRLRSVCKRWKNFIFSEAYFLLRSCLSYPSHSCLLLSTHGHLACLYNFLLEKWHYLPLPRIRLPIFTPPLSLLYASQSLLCLGNQVAECSVLFVCNPFTQSLRNLPPMSKIRYIHKLSLTVVNHPSGDSYRILVAGEDHKTYLANPPHPCKLLTEIYDSKFDTWKTAGSPLPESVFGTDPGVWCRGLFYCITEMPYGVMAFDAAAQSWKWVECAMPVGLATPSLVECRGRLLMVGRIKHKRAAALQIPDKIAIWELAENTGELQTSKEVTEIVNMPESLCEELLRPLHGLTPLVSAGIDNVVCITTHLTRRVLVFDLITSDWRCLPQDPLFPDCRSFRLMGYPVEPRMDCLP